MPYSQVIRACKISPPNSLWNFNWTCPIRRKTSIQEEFPKIVHPRLSVRSAENGPTAANQNNSKGITTTKKKKKILTCDTGL